MAQTYTIESADDDVPLDPELLRELRDLLRADEDLDIGVRLKDRPPAPGEQGALPVALEIIAAGTPLATALAGVLVAWVNARKVHITMRSGDLTVEVRAGSDKDAERLIAMLERGTGPEPGNRG
jgi:hypothetical protein